MVRVKICGITNQEDALKAASLGAWALGFIFYKRSPRYIGPYKAKKIIDQLPPFIIPVGVFVNQKEGAVKEIVNFCGIKTIQFHGEETPAYCQRFKNFKVIKAFRVDKKIDLDQLKSYEADAFLFDAFTEDSYGGSGKTFNWSLIKGAKNLQKPIILSGGLHYNNISAAVLEVKPYAVDVSSGVEESPGKKSEHSMREFLNRVYMESGKQQAIS